MGTNLISVAIADDHKAVRQAFMAALSSDIITFIFEADNGFDLIDKLSIKKPDVLLLDIKMPGLNGIDALKIIHEKFAEVKVLVFSAFTDQVYVSQCLQYGIYGFFSKTSEVAEIVKAIEMAHNNEVYLTNLIGTQLYRNYIVSFHKRKMDALPNFTNEEIKLIELMKAEKTTEEISEIMNLSKRSVELKRDKMREKSNTKTIGGLLLYAVKRGFIE